MAVHCDICGTSILSAMESHDGKFDAGNNFVSINPYSNGKKNNITDVCNSCGYILTEELAALKEQLASATLKAIDKIRSQH